MNASTSVLLLAVFVAISGSESAGGQARQTSPPSTPAREATQAARAPRSPAVLLDLQGVWNFATITPLERPADRSDKAVLTADEVNALEADAASRNDRPPRPGQTGVFNGFWWDLGRSVPDRRSSLVIDPADGRIPFTPEGQKRATAPRGLDSWDQRSAWERCVTRNAAPLMPAGYNNSAQIVQAPGYVVILIEAVHDVRVIPLDGRPHLDANVRQWLGDARGRWEGETLVVETTNFSGQHSFQGATERLRLIERFTRIDRNTLSYEFRLEDAATFTRPWTVASVFTRDTTGELYEYACHEGNSGLVGILRGARVQEQRAGAGTQD